MTEYKDLIALSKLFKEGFTIEVKDGQLRQFCGKDRPFIVGHKPLITINSDKSTKYHTDKVPENGIIGGWLNGKTLVYLITSNLAFRTKRHALQIAKTLKQKYIYNIILGECIKV